MLERYRWPGNVRELQNVVEQSLWMSNGARVEVAHLPPAVQAAGDVLVPMRERRRQVSDELYRRSCRAATRSGSTSTRCFSRATSRATTCGCLVRKGLSTTRGNYRALLRLFGLGTQDYKRFLNFLAAHECTVDFREFRHGSPCLSGAAAAARARRPAVSPAGPDRRSRPPALLISDRRAGPRGRGDRRQFVRARGRARSHLAPLQKSRRRLALPVGAAVAARADVFALLALRAAGHPIDAGVLERGPAGTACSMRAAAT